MPVKLPKRSGLPESIKRHVALRELAHEEARARPAAVILASGGGLSRKQADARAKEMAKEPMPHTKRFWDSVIAPGEEG